MLDPGAVNFTLTMLKLGKEGRWEGEDGLKEEEKEEGEGGLGEKE